MMPEIHNLFTKHRLEWAARLLGPYSEEMVREFYASYVATLRSQIDMRASPAKQAPLEQVRVRGCSLTFPYLSSASFYTARVLMLLGPLSLPSLTTAGRLLRMVISHVSHR